MISQKAKHKAFGFVATVVLGALLGTAIPLSIFANANDLSEVNAAVGNYTTDPATYYNSVSGLSGNSLLFGLHDLMISSHQNYTVYDDSGSNGYQAYTDKDPNNSNNIIAWYCHASISKTWDNGATYNREHVWPQNLSNGLYGTTGAGADMHHIRPTISYINNYRNNSKYGYVGSSYSTTTYRSGDLVSKYTSTIFEPHDEVKGDAARIVMYMYVHYNSSKALGNGSTVEAYTGTMPITNVIDGTTSAAWSLLLDWNELDPVDALETNRNNQVAIYQGNRNPFIDHPEYANQIWGTATAPTSLSLSPSSANIDAGSTQTLSVSASPSGASTSVSWSTSNSGVATVSAGVVTGVAAGSATITATSTMNSNVKATASITVNDVTLNSISIKTPASNTNFKLGETFSSSGLVINANYSNGTVEKSSGFAVTGVDTMVLGVQTATITYEGKATTYSVDVTNVGANAGSYQSNPDGYNSLYAGSGMWTTTVANFSMNGSTYGTYSAAYLSSTDASASRSWTISVGNVGNWGSGTITTVAGANIGANTSTQYGNNVIPSAISSMANYTTIVSSKNPLYVGMNFDASNAAKFSMKFITEKAMDAYVVYSTNGGSSYSTIGSKQTTSATDGSTWYEVSYASETSLGSSVRFGVLMISSAGTGIRNRIGDIGVYSYTSGSEGWVDGDFTPLEQATSYANYVMTGIGQNAAGNCAAVKSELDTEYAAMSDLAKDEFAANSTSVFINARARITYLDAWVSSQSPSGIQSPKNDSKVLLIISVIITTIGLTAISGFYFINKKKTISN